MALYERLMGIETKLPIHGFVSVAVLWGMGDLTDIQARTALANIGYGQALTPAEETQAIALVDKVRNIAITGAAAAQADARARRGLMLERINSILILSESGTAPYDTPAKVEAAITAL